MLLYQIRYISVHGHRETWDGPTFEDPLEAEKFDKKINAATPEARAARELFEIDRSGVYIIEVRSRTR